MGWNQLDLFAPLPVNTQDGAVLDGTAGVTRDFTLRERFDRFHRANPHVFERLRAMALEQRAAVAARTPKDKPVPSLGSMAQLFEVLRYQASLTTAGDDFKLNNSFRAFYVRELERRSPTLLGWFRKRASAADEKGDDAE